MIVRRAPGSAPERRLISYHRGARRWLMVSVLAGVLAVFALVGQLIAVSIAVAGVFLAGRTLTDVTPLLLAGLALVLLRSGLAALSDLSARRSSHVLVGALRAGITGQVLRLGPTWTSGERSGEISGVLVGGLESIDEYVTQFLPARWLAMIVPVLVLLIVLVLDPPSVVVLLFTGPLLLLLVAVIGGRTRSITERRFLELRTLSAFFLDILHGLGTLKMFGRSGEQANNLRRISSRYGDATMDVLRTAFQTSLVLEWGAAIAVALVAVEIGLRLLEDGISFERALAVLLITPEFFLPLRQLAIRYHVGTAGKAVIDRTFEILDEPAPVDTADAVDEAAEAAGAAARAHVPTRPLLDRAPHLRFEAVSFTYRGRDVAALDGLSMDVAPGTSLALVGASGAGKSTLASLLLRFIEPDDGLITVDGRPLLELSRSAWRASLAWVPQRPHLFDGSIRENILMARPDAEMRAVRGAAASANAAGFIAELPQGYDTLVGEHGARLSGGQRQRIAIARAFLRDTPLLLLDEATSYQDEASELAIADAIDRLVVGRTVVLIAHRLRLAQRAGQVAVLGAGRVLEAGAPADLFEREGPYRRLLCDDDTTGPGP